MIDLFTTASDLVLETYTEFAPFQPDLDPEKLEEKYTNEASSFVNIHDARVHYRDEGPPDAPTVVLIHGTYSSLHTWDGWVSEFGDEFRTVRLDMPGFGLTGPRDGEHTLKDLVLTVAALCDHLDLKDVAVAGNSLGGGVAWRLSLERPDLVSRLILLNSGGATLLSAVSGNLISALGPVTQRYITPRIATRLILLDAYHDNSKVTREVVERYHDLLLRRGNRAAAIELASNYERDHYNPDEDKRHESSLPTLPASHEAHPDVWDDYDISDLAVPTLFQWGSEDTWLSESFGRELSVRVPQSEFVVYDGVGHAPMEEAPIPTAMDAMDAIRS